MTLKYAPDAEIDAQRLFEGFENLMPFRVRDSFSAKTDG